MLALNWNYCCLKLAWHWHIQAVQPNEVPSVPDSWTPYTDAFAACYLSSLNYTVRWKDTGRQWTYSVLENLQSLFWMKNSVVVRVKLQLFTLLRAGTRTSCWGQRKAVHRRAEGYIQTYCYHLIRTFAQSDAVRLRQTWYVRLFQTGKHKWGLLFWNWAIVLIYSFGKSELNHLN